MPAEFKQYTMNGVTCSATRRRSSSRDDKAWERTVRYKDNERVVHYADPDMPMRRNNEEARENFISRHNCDDKKDPFVPGFWACYDWINTDEKSMIKQVNSIKAVELDDGAIQVEGYLVKFTDENDRDLDNQYFDKNTDFMKGSYKIVGSPILYQHALDDKLKRFDAVPIGQITEADYRDDGIFARGVINLKKSWNEYIRGILDDLEPADEWEAHQMKVSEEYQRAIANMVNKGVIGWSSGAMPQTVIADNTGHIKRWGIIEGSLTPSPAEPDETSVKLLKSLGDAVQSVHELRETLKSKEATTKATDPITEETIKAEDMEMTPEELRKFILSILSEMGIEAPDSMAAEAMEEMKQDIPEEEMLKMETEELAEKMASKVIELMRAADEKREKARKAVAKQAEAYKRDVPSNEEVPSVKTNTSTPNKGANISVGEIRAYAGLSGSDMALGVKLAASRVPELDRKAWKLKDFVDRGILSEDYIKAMAHKTAAEVDAWQPRNDKLELNDYAAVKASRPFKADELHATDITNQGTEWVELMYDADLWRRVRDTTELFNLMQQKGMRVQDIPTGVKGMNIKLETGSGTVYTLQEANSNDATGRPEVVAQMSNITTDEVEENLATHIIAQGFTFQLQERSIIDVVSYLNEDMLTTLSEAIEDAFINGDKTTTASSNINLIDGTPGSGVQSPLYLAWDGIRHNVLVDNTSMGIDNANAKLAAIDYERVRALFPVKFRNRRDNFLFIIDGDIETKTRRLSEWFTTSDPINQAPFFTGELEKLVNYSVYTSGFLAKSNGNGKISATSGNNTQGNMYAVFAPYWQYGRQLQINIEQARYPLSQTTVFVATVNHLLKARSQYAAAGLYDVDVS